MKASEKIAGKGGAVFTEADIIAVRRLVEFPDALADQLRTLPLVGLCMYLDANEDPTGMGIHLEWMNATDVLSEACDAHPGVVAVKYGYTPVGTCLLGSGDPYFYRNVDGAIVRIPHEATIDDAFRVEQIEPVAESIEALVAMCEVAPPGQ